MTADNYSKKDPPPHRSLFQTLPLVFAGLTLFFALFSIITGNRLSTLRADHLNALKESDSLETASIAEVRTALDNAQANLEIAKQDAAAEKKNAEKLHQKLSTTQKELEKVKADLAAANQSIADFKATLPAEPATSVDTSNPAPLPDPGHPTKPASPQGQLPARQTPDQPATPPPPDQTPAETPPENPSPKPPPPVSGNNTGGSPPPAVGVSQQSSQTMSPVTEETISDATQPPSPQPAATE
jgi:hypothetical protein